VAPFCPHLVQRKCSHSLPFLDSSHVVAMWPLLAHLSAAGQLSFPILPVSIWTNTQYALQLVPLEILSPDRKSILTSVPTSLGMGDSASHGTVPLKEIFLSNLSQCPHFIFSKRVRTLKNYWCLEFPLNLHLDHIGISNPLSEWIGQNSSLSTWYITPKLISLAKTSLVNFILNTHPIKW
jgi:hypothetical protein